MFLKFWSILIFETSILLVCFYCVHGYYSAKSVYKKIGFETKPGLSSTIDITEQQTLKKYVIFTFLFKNMTEGIIWFRGKQSATARQKQPIRWCYDPGTRDMFFPDPSQIQPILLRAQ